MELPFPTTPEGIIYAFLPILIARASLPLPERPPSGRQRRIRPLPNRSSAPPGSTTDQPVTPVLVITPPVRRTLPAPPPTGKKRKKLPYLMPGTKEKTWAELAEAARQRNGPNPAPTPLHPWVHSVQMLASEVPLRRAGTPPRPKFGVQGPLTRAIRRPVEHDQAPRRTRRRTNGFSVNRLIDHMRRRRT